MSEPEPELATAPQSKYRDGTFTGSAQGFEGSITVSVTLQGDRITNVSVVSSGDDPDFFGDASSSVIPAIISRQSADVSAVSGATYSSYGIMNAVRAALAAALND